VAGSLNALLVTEPEGAIEVSVQVSARALHGGLSAIVVRRPNATASEVFELTRQLRPATRKLGALLIVSDRLDVALAAGADGVHLGARSLPIKAARRVLKSGMLLGRSVHNLDEAGQAEEQGADYLFLGPVFETRSHPGRKPLGLEPYREAVLRSEIPVLAIGGVESGNVEQIAAAGGEGAAAISAFFDAEDPAETARLFRAAFGT
jgi:thiamine-phosphate pyrophosphorylase